jgi:hypothetical protein
MFKMHKSGSLNQTHYGMDRNSSRVQPKIFGVYAL